MPPRLSLGFLMAQHSSGRYPGIFGWEGVLRPAGESDVAAVAPVAVTSDISHNPFSARLQLTGASDPAHATTTNCNSICTSASTVAAAPSLDAPGAFGPNLQPSVCGTPRSVFCLTGKAKSADTTLLIGDSSAQLPTVSAPRSSPRSSEGEREALDWSDIGAEAIQAPLLTPEDSGEEAAPANSQQQQGRYRFRNPYRCGFRLGRCFRGIALIVGTRDCLPLYRVTQR